MKNAREFIWPVIGLLAVVVSCWLLYRELRGLSLDDVWDSLTAVPSHRYALAGLCSFTFGLGTILLGGVVLTANPTLLHRLEDLLPSALTNPATARVVGFLLLGFVALYVAGSILHLRPIVIRKHKLEY